MVTVEKVEKIDLLKFLKLCKKFWSRSIRFLREHLAKNIFFFCKVLSFIYSQSLKIFYFTSGCGGQESSEIFGSLILAEKQPGLYGNKVIRIRFTATELWPWLLWKRLGNLKRNRLKFLTLCYRFLTKLSNMFFSPFPMTERNCIQSLNETKTQVVTWCQTLPQRKEGIPAAGFKLRWRKCWETAFLISLKNLSTSPPKTRLGNPRFKVSESWTSGLTDSNIQSFLQRF